MSQPALSGAVAALEEGLGTQLVERTTRKVLLTSAGERVARRAELILAELDRLVEDARAERGPLVGPLRMGVIPTVAPYLLPTVLPALRDGFPGLALSVREEQTDPSLTDLLSGRLDVAVLALPVRPGVTGVTEIPLYDEDFVLVAPDGFEPEHIPGSDDLMPPEALKELDVLLLNEGHCMRDQTLDVCREVGARPAAATYATSLATLVQLVSGGLGVTLLPESAIHAETRRGESGLAVHRIAAPAPYRRIGLVHRTSSPRAAEFGVLADSIRGAVASRDWQVRLAAWPGAGVQSLGQGGRGRSRGVGAGRHPGPHGAVSG